MNLKTLRRDFKTLSMKPDMSVQDYFSCISIPINQMRIYGENISKQNIVEKILRCLPSAFDYFVVAIEEPRDLSTFNENELLGSLVSHKEMVNRNQIKLLEKKFQSRFDKKKRSQMIKEVPDEETSVDKHVEVKIVDMSKEIANMIEI